MMSKLFMEKTATAKVYRALKSSGEKRKQKTIEALRNSPHKSNQDLAKVMSGEMSSDEYNRNLAHASADRAMTKARKVAHMAAKLEKKDPKFASIVSDLLAGKAGAQEAHDKAVRDAFVKKYYHKYR